MKTNSTIYENVYTGAVGICLSVKEKVRSGYPDLPPLKFSYMEDFYTVNRAISDSIKESIKIYNSELRIDKEVIHQLKKEDSSGWEKHMKQKMIYEIAEKIYRDNLFQLEEINAYENLSRPHKQYRMSLPVLNWRRPDLGIETE